MGNPSFLMQNKRISQTLFLPRHDQILQTFKHRHRRLHQLNSIIFAPLAVSVRWIKSTSSWIHELLHRIYSFRWSHDTRLNENSSSSLNHLSITSDSSLFIIFLLFFVDACSKLVSFFKWRKHQLKSRSRRQHLWNSICELLSTMTR